MGWGGGTCVAGEGLEQSQGRGGEGVAGFSGQEAPKEKSSRDTCLAQSEACATRSQDTDSGPHIGYRDYLEKRKKSCSHCVQIVGGGVAQRRRKGLSLSSSPMHSWYQKYSFTHYIKRRFAHNLDYLTVEQASSPSSEFPVPRSSQAGTV